ncbi:uncharacterized protein [Diadema setosum]|uniref:uncharacterized protein n=1 Tax=Diadema setosum TaxID=31175 RepID=UPI003B3A522B
MSPELRYIFFTSFLILLVSHTALARGRACPAKLMLLCGGGVGKRDTGISQSAMATNAETYRKDFMLEALRGFRQTVCPFDSVIEQFSREQQLDLWQIIHDFGARNGLDLR